MQTRVSRSRTEPDVSTGSSAVKQPVPSSSVSFLVFLSAYALLLKSCVYQPQQPLCAYLCVGSTSCYWSRWDYPSTWSVKYPQSRYITCLRTNILHCSIHHIAIATMAWSHKLLPLTLWPGLWAVMDQIVFLIGHSCYWSSNPSKYGINVPRMQNNKHLTIAPLYVGWL